MASMSHQSTRAVSPTDPCPHATALGTVMRQLAVSLTVAVGVPAALFYAIFQFLGLTPAILAALVWAYGAIAWRLVTHRPTSGLLVLTATILTLRTIFTLSTGNTFIYFLQPVISDAIVATVFLVSLMTARPLVARLAADFYPMSPEVAEHPLVRRLFWRLTLGWGGMCILKAIIGFWMLEVMSVGTFVLVKSSTMMGMTIAGVAVTTLAALVVLRHESVRAAGVPAAS